MFSKKSDNLFYAVTIFMEMDVQRGLFVLYLLQVGLSHGEIGILQSLLFFANMALEVPSGLLADRYGRRFALVTGFLGFVLNGIGFLLFSSFLPFAILFCLYGASLAMGSGADRALLYDNLMAQGRQGEYARILSRARAMGAVSLGLSILAGGVIQDAWSWNAVYLVFALTKLVGAALVVLLPEYRLGSSSQNLGDGKRSNPVPTDEVEPEPALTKAVVSFFKSRSGYSLLPLFVGFALFEVGFVPLYIYAQDFFLVRGLSIPMVAGVYAVVEIATAIMFVAAGYGAMRWSLMPIAFWSTIVMSGLLAILSQEVGPVTSVVLFLLVMALSTFYETSYEAYINDSIDSRIRATCLSVNNLVRSILVGLSFMLFGGVLDYYDFPTAILTVMVICLCGFMGVMLTWKLRVTI